MLARKRLSGQLASGFAQFLPADCRPKEIRIPQQMQSQARRLPVQSILLFRHWKGVLGLALQMGACNCGFLHRHGWCVLQPKWEEQSCGRSVWRFSLLRRGLTKCFWAARLCVIPCHSLPQSDGSDDYCDIGSLTSTVESKNEKRQALHSDCVHLPHEWINTY